MKMRMGFEGQILCGNPGSTATGLLENSRDIAFEFDYDAGDSTPRGDGSAPPIASEEVCIRKMSITFNMLNGEGDTLLAQLLTAAYGGTPIALRLKDVAAGKGPDADFSLKVKDGKPLKGEATYDFTAAPSRAFREPELYV